MTASPEGFPPQDLRSFLELCEGEWLALRSHFDLALVADETPAAAMTAAAAAESDPATALEAGPAALDAAAQGDTAPQASVADTADDEVAAPAAAAEDDAADADGLPDFAALLQQARAQVEEAPSEEPWHSSERGELLVAFLAPQQADQLGGLRVTAPEGGSRELQFHADGTFAAPPDQAPSAAGAAVAGAVIAGQWQLWPDGSLELILEAPGRLVRERIWFTQPNLRLRSSVEHAEGGLPGRARFSSEIRRVRKPAA